MCGQGLAGRAGLVAVGGYGRKELSPHSDIDLLVLSTRPNGVSAGELRALLYPLWDAGFQVGHALATPKEAIERAERDLDAATALLSARLVAGPPELFEELLDRAARWLRRAGRGLARRILDGVAERHRRVERAGWSLAPDIKEDVGGLRDLHALYWLAAIAKEPVGEEARAAGELLLDVREALHGCTRRKNDRLLLELQPQVARRLGLADAGELMGPVHRAARHLEHAGAIEREQRARGLLGGPRRSGQIEDLGGGVRIIEGRISAPALRHLADALRVLAAVSATGKRPDLPTLRALEAAFARASPGPMGAAEQQALFCVLEGRAVRSALELADHLGALAVLVPSLTAVRALAQHDPYHRHTVDAHCFQCVAEVNHLLATDDTVSRLAPEIDLRVLRLGALLHDVGKGGEGDHSVTGEAMARAEARRLGLGADDATDVGLLVRHHLLLPDTATRRDLDDGAVIDRVAKAVREPRLLKMLYVLAVADGRATGPSAWSGWKATLVRALFNKVLIALSTGELPPRSDVAARAREIEAFEPALAGRAAGVLATLPPSYLSSTPVVDMAEELKLLLDPPRAGEVRWHIEEGDGRAAVTVCVTDRPGTLARTAGVLALNRLSVLHAQAFSTTTGLALERFVVEAPRGLDRARLVADLSAAYSGRLALDARLGRKIAHYAPGRQIVIDVRFLPDASAHSTVLEVRAPDVLGMLYALCSALSELDIDIHVAKIDTLGERVVDVFYVRNAWGEPLSSEQMAEVERALSHRVERLFGR